MFLCHPESCLSTSKRFRSKLRQVVTVFIYKEGFLMQWSPSHSLLLSCACFFFSSSCIWWLYQALKLCLNRVRIPDIRNLTSFRYREDSGPNVYLSISADNLRKVFGVTVDGFLTLALPGSEMWTLGTEFSEPVQFIFQALAPCMG